MKLSKQIMIILLGMLIAVSAMSVEKRRWNLQDVDIKMVTEEVSRVTGKNFILDPSVTGKITMISSSDLDSTETYEVYLSALQVLGYAAIPEDGVIKIVPDSQARHLGGVSGGNAKGASVVAEVIALKYVPASQMVPTLRNLVSPSGHLAAYVPSNSLIIADRASNVARIVELVSRLDVEDSGGMEIVTLQNASAGDVVSAVGQMLQSQRRGQEGTNLTLGADDRTNSVIFSGDKASRSSIRDLIAKLDVKVKDQGNTEVIYLKFQKAELMVPVLGNILDSYAAQLESRSPNGARAPAKSQMTDPTVFQTTQTNFHQKKGDDTLQTDRQAAGLVIGPYGVQAEPNTNALIITAPPSLMRSMKNVINRLDVRRSQVLVEAIIVEVRGNKAEEWGVEWRGAGDIAGGTTFPGTDDTLNGLLNTYQANLDAGSAMLPGSGLAVGFIRGGSLRTMLHALESDSSVNVLSTPSLVAMDNAPALIKVGTNIPFPIGEYATTGGENTVTPFVTTEYRDVGLELNILPQITSGEAIQMQITQKVDNLGPLLLDKPTTSMREVTTEVLVDDGDILVLGGLISTEDRTDISKVPFLGDIPLFGKLFQNETLRTEKTNLMIFIRPVIMRDKTKSGIVTQDKYNTMRSLQILSHEPNDMESDLLPPWQYTDAVLPKPFDVAEE
ncbi:MAG: type II secretion system secretin GspD [Gammaproteobacteria bacterium]